MAYRLSSSHQTTLFADAAEQELKELGDGQRISLGEENLRG